MKKLWCVVVLLLLFNSVGFAAQGISVGGGLTNGSLTWEWNANHYEHSSGLGFYLTASGAFQVKNLPFAFSGSYSNFSTDTLTSFSEITPTELQSDIDQTPNSSSLMKLLVGYALPQVPLAVGAGFVSQVASWDYGASDVETLGVSGLALAAFGSVPVFDRAQVGAQLFYCPSLSIEYASGSGLGFEMSGSYQLKPQIALEAGYQSFTSTIQVKSTNKMTTSSLFAGAKYSF